MKTSIYILEFKIFLKSKAAIAGIALLLAAGVISLYLGKTFIARQQAVIEQAASLQKQNTARNLKYFGKELGTLLYHNKFAVASIPDSWAAFSNGQRDINPYLLSVSILGLKGQLFDTDLNNPSTLLMGNMDMAFVFIFLFPLVILAFCYNLLSAEKESGIWSLIKAQSENPGVLLWRRLTVRATTVLLTAAVLMLFSCIYLNVQADLKLLAVCALILCYISFWFAISYWIVSLGRSSSFNAVSLISFWIGLNIVAPASLNVWLSEKYPLPEALEMVIAQREGYHEKWDLDKQVTMKAFYDHYPQFKKFPFPNELTFSWYWYYAMQQNGDDQGEESMRKMLSKLSQRRAFTNFATMILPGIRTQLGLNQLAGSDLESHLAFQRAMTHYHENLRMGFYPIIFKNETAAKINWQSFSLEHFKPQPNINVWESVASMALLTIVFAGLSSRNSRRSRF